uniref:Transcriptional activator, TenA family n=1 Tax=uncultured organism TaxID=155900 RepID=M1P125_9ZZZZ|nr:transcriptional activator, TenA family [uncultured organism]
MNITERLRKEADEIWKEIKEHPFVVELYTGDLPLDKFEFYILQDYYYLVKSIRNFSIISSKASSVDNMREVTEILHLEAQSEFEGYEEFLDRLGYSLEDAAKVEPIPVNVSYSSFLISTSSLNSFELGITSVLPCFWSYAEIAEYHRDKLSENNKQIYKDWAKVYETKSYLNLVERMKDIVNEVGEGYPFEELKDVFITASRYEYMFWDAVYNKKGWPI